MCASSLWSLREEIKINKTTQNSRVLECSWAKNRLRIKQQSAEWEGKSRFILKVSWNFFSYYTERKLDIIRWGETRRRRPTSQNSFIFDDFQKFLHATQLRELYRHLILMLFSLPVARPLGDPPCELIQKVSCAVTSCRRAPIKSS